MGLFLYTRHKKFLITNPVVRVKKNGQQKKVARKEENGLWSSILSNCSY